MKENTPVTFSWPEESKGFVDFHENLQLIYGLPKVGKTTFASQYTAPLFFATEPGHKHVKVSKYDIRNWAEFLVRIKELEDNIGACPFRTIVIDTVDNLSDMCVEFVVKKLEVDDLADAGYGKGFAAHAKEFNKAIARLARLGLGVVFISHAEEKEVDADSVVSPYAIAAADNKGKVNMVVPSMDKRARKFICGLVDMIFYINISADLKRVIHAQPNKSFEAGDRSGRLPHTMPLDHAAVIKEYYGGEGRERGAMDDLLKRIDDGVAYLADKGIDSFDVKTRVDNWRNKHIGDNPTLVTLQEALQDLKVKAKTKKVDK